LVTLVLAHFTAGRSDETSSRLITSSNLITGPTGRAAGLWHKPPSRQLRASKNEAANEGGLTV